MDSADHAECRYACGLLESGIVKTLVVDGDTARAIHRISGEQE
ncbi:hypothetical protein Q669_27825 [Labrenzia sp. C1B10]|nr:hypothetical protein Q669_27825 [Labrenzia sp. C1B10]ERS03526.1 hypothetical protein Q675_31130 [Labrenzia sp. C1B70]